MISRRTQAWLMLLPAILVGSCAASTTPTSTTASSTTTVPPTATQSTTTSAASTTPPCLTEDQAFATDGALASGLLDGQEGDAELVSGIRWTAFPGCERLVVELATAGGAPATEPGGVRAELLRDLGIVRLRLDDRVTSTAIADRLVEGDLVDRVYVVRSLSGELYIDIHLESAALARASINRSPALLVVDLQAGGSELEARPITADLAVVVSPTGARAEYPLTVEGYARTFEATVVIRIRQGNRLDLDDLTTAADYLVTWGEFRFQLTGGPKGNIELFVGEDSPRDGEERGVRFNLVMG